MLYLTREDSVELLPLSKRTSNCLRRAEVHTVGQLLDYPADKWPDIRNMGTKSVGEVLDITARIRGGDGFELAASRPKPPEPPPPPRLPEIPVQELGLSVRANNCLERMGRAPRRICPRPPWNPCWRSRTWDGKPPNRSWRS